MREIWIGILASLFFAVTFVLNRTMELSGGSWLWSASLRYFFMVPFLIAIVAYRKGLGQTKKEMITKPAPFFIWSVVAFVLFYAPLTYAAAYSPGWLLAGTWQLTIVAGVLLAPLFTIIVKTNAGKQKIRQKIPAISLCISLIILVGVVLIQIPHAQSVDIRTLWLGIIPVSHRRICIPTRQPKNDGTTQRSARHISTGAWHDTHDIAYLDWVCNLCVMDSRSSVL